LKTPVGILDGKIGMFASPATKRCGFNSKIDSPRYKHENFCRGCEIAYPKDVHFCHKCHRMTRKKPHRRGKLELPRY